MAVAVAVAVAVAAGANPLATRRVWVAQRLVEPAPALRDGGLDHREFAANNGQIEEAMGDAGDDLVLKRVAQFPQPLCHHDAVVEQRVKLGSHQVDRRQCCRAPAQHRPTQAVCSATERKYLR